MNAQSDSIHLSGFVFDAGNKESLVHARILVNQNLAATTDSIGYFDLFISRENTVSFSFLGYKAFNFQATDSMIRGSYVVGIALSPDTINLNAFVVLPQNDFNNLTYAFQQPLPESKNYFNANENLRLSTHQALTGQHQYADADANYKLLMTQNNQRVMDKGLVPQTQTLGITAALLIPVWLAREMKKEGPKTYHIHTYEKLLIKRLLFYQAADSVNIPDSLSH
jgi:hypothetical protein